MAPMKNCPGGGGVQGNLNWMPGYKVSTAIRVTADMYAQLAVSYDREHFF